MKTQADIDRIEFFKNELKAKLQWSFYPEQQTGGQSCGVMPKGCILKCNETAFEVKVLAHRSMIKNRELALQLYDFYLDEYYKF